MSEVSVGRVDASRLEQACRALASERMRMRRYRRALTSARDDALRNHWTLELQASGGRAARLAVLLVDLGERDPNTQERSGCNHCLPGAMERALSKGDLPAAEAVALECMRLMETRCVRMHDKPG